MENDLADQSILYVYADSPKHLASEEQVAKVDEVRRLVQSEQWCKEVKLVTAERNKGQVTSFVDGITDVVNEHGKVIVLEDDQVTSKGFLKFMNEALEIYKDDEKVMHVSGYMYPAEFECKDTTFFLQVQSCPGWGTWKRAWDLYNHDAADHFTYFNQTKERRRKFDIEGNAYYFSQLKKNSGTKLYSWAVRWHASCIRAGGLSLFPVKSLVQNIGCDDTGVHCGEQARAMYQVEPTDYLPIKRVPVVENQAIRRSVDNHYKAHLKKKRRSLRSLLSPKALILPLYKILLKILRKLVGAAFPELRNLDSETARRVGLLSTAYDSSVADRARVHAPYSLENATVGDYSYIMPNSRISIAEIGKYCSIGSNFLCGGGIHPIDGISSAPMFYSTNLWPYSGSTASRPTEVGSISGTDKCVERKLVVIGNDVFIGMNVTILDGVTIGDGAVIGAGCVVSKNVPPYAVVVGSPMKILRFRFNEGLRNKLLKLRWWDWPEEKLSEIEEMFFDVDEFVEKQGGVEELDRNPVLETDV
jgi:acetyltransferase-like isoleucine patch superfamily enzyme